jgi:hypothetical protein
MSDKAKRDAAIAKRQSVREEILKSLRTIEDPEEYAGEDRRYDPKSQEYWALRDSPEGKKRSEDGRTGAGMGIAAFLAQRMARRAFRTKADRGFFEGGYGERSFKNGGGGVAKSGTGVGAITLPFSAAVGAHTEQQRGVGKRIADRKKR